MALVFCGLESVCPTQLRDGDSPASNNTCCVPTSGKPSFLFPAAVVHGSAVKSPPSVLSKGPNGRCTQTKRRVEFYGVGIEHLVDFSVNITYHLFPTPSFIATLPCEPPTLPTLPQSPTLRTTSTTIHGCFQQVSLTSPPPPPPRLSNKVLRVGVRTQEMWQEHVALTTDFPDASLPPGGDDSAVSPDAVRRKRLVYRSKQRGWLEASFFFFFMCRI